MNIINNQKALGRLWAALYCDFERVLAQFMRSKGWRYVHFAGICRETKITLVMHITQGKGKTKDEHYRRMTDMILQLCKDLWLPVVDLTREREKSIIDKTMDLKRGLGAFYLLYTMFEKQPIRDRVKIALGISDLQVFCEFCSAVKRLPFYEEVIFMIEYLLHKEAFYHCIYSTEYRFDASTRNFLNNSKCEVVELTKRMRDIQDVLAHSSVHDVCENTFRHLTEKKLDVAGDLLKTVTPRMMHAHLHGRTLFSRFVKTVSSDSLLKAFNRIDKMVNQPVVTMQNLTATEAIDRRIMMETRARMERARKKGQGHHSEPDGTQKEVNPYVREGGIFGRKKETDNEKGEPSRRRERGTCTGNLWVYINGYDFDKPMGEPREQAPPAPKPSS